MIDANSSLGLSLDPNVGEQGHTRGFREAVQPSAGVSVLTSRLGSRFTPMQRTCAAGVSLIIILCLCLK